MDEGFLAPICLVDVEAVLLCLAVEGHQALMVHARLATLISGIRREVEHIPKMGRPHERTFFEEFQHILIVLALIFLALVAPAGVGAVEIGHTLAAVLRVAQTAVGIDRVEEVHPQLVQEHTRHIPA